MPDVHTAPLLMLVLEELLGSSDVVPCARACPRRAAIFSYRQDGPPHTDF